MNKGTLIFRQNLKITAIVFYATSLDYEKVPQFRVLVYTTYLISTKKFIHKNAYIPEFLFAISLEKSLKSFSSRTNNDYVFIFQATKQ